MTYCIIHTVRYLWNRRNVGFGCLIHTLGSRVTRGAFPLVSLAAPSQTVPCWFAFDQQFFKAPTWAVPHPRWTISGAGPERTCPTSKPAALIGCRALFLPIKQDHPAISRVMVLHEVAMFSFFVFFCWNAFPCCSGLILTESNGFKLSQHMCMETKAPSVVSTVTSQQQGSGFDCWFMTGPFCEQFSCECPPHVPVNYWSWSLGHQLNEYPTLLYLGWAKKRFLLYVVLCTNMCVWQTWFDLQYL